MNLWNVFRMEIFKNLHDRVNIFIIIVLMCVNIIGGIVVSDLFVHNNFWNWGFNPPTMFQGMMLLLLVFSIFASFAFTFIYPFQLVRTDYTNKVMSLIIASGVSRIQYYFVKVGATLLFSLVSFLFIAFIPVIIATRGVALFNFWNMQVNWGFGLFVFFLAWLSMFFTMMTSTIMVKGHWSSIFIYFGLSIGTSMVFTLLQGILGISMWDTNTGVYNAFTIFQQLSTSAIFAMIGILILRKQDL